LPHTEGAQERQGFPYPDRLRNAEQHRLSVGRHRNLKTLLPQIDGKRHVDLLVVTHEHKDHMTGFGLDLWTVFRSGRSG
jgi:phosphoribosyl 1,2-cyclic phosphodiesterase